MLQKNPIWPMITPRGEIINGIICNAPDKCLECNHKTCKMLHTRTNVGIYEFNCPKNLTCYYGATDHSFVIIGVISPENDAAPKNLKKDKPRYVTLEMIKNWIENNQPSHSFDDSSKTNNNIFSFHNIQPLVNILLRESEEMINKSSGNDIEIKLGNSSRELQRIHYTLELMTWMIGTQNEMINVNIIETKKHTETAVFPIVDKLVRCFRTLAEGHWVHLYILGESHNKRKCTDSLGNMFFILIENAIKYSLPNQNVSIRVSDRQNRVYVEIESYGPIVGISEREKIFESGFRGKFASQYLRAGTGRGLFVAQKIANYHHTAIKYHPPTNIVTKDNIQVGVNIFSVEI